MATAVTLNHPGGARVKAFKGWSWTSFFFGPFPPLFRGDMKWFFIVLAVHMVLVPLSFFLFGLPNTIFALVVAAKYNEWHYQDMIQKGYIRG